MAVNWINLDLVETDGDGFTSYVRPERPWPADKLMEALKNLTAVRTGKHGQPVGFITNQGPAIGLDSWHPVAHDTLDEAFERITAELGDAHATEEVRFP